jgi:type III pantothenate kinase
MTASLLIDLGNTRIKWRVLSAAGEVLAERAAAFREVPLADALPGNDAGVSRVLIASVWNEVRNEEVASLCEARFGHRPWFAETVAKACGLTNSYEEPAKMGVDRWLAMLAAWRHIDAACCVVDAGSALTIDLVSDRGEHLGGYILPGRQLMARSLLVDTDRVRFALPAEPTSAPGRSTAEAVGHGACLAQVGAVEEALRVYARQAPAGVDEPEVLVCGGDAELLIASLARPVRHVPGLVLDGLAIMAEEAGAISRP